jgi:acyl-CoA thioesterase
MSAISDQERAERSSEAMLRDDHTTKGFGMKIESVGPGVATISMVVRKDHLNGHGTCHGVSVAQHCSVTFLAPGREGDRLIAKAREVTRAGRSGVYDVTVMREDEAVIAEFRGLSRTISGTHFEETAG